MEVLPPLEYIELASIQIGEELMHKITEKFK